MEHFLDAVNFFVTMISILNPLGAIPTFITLTQPYSKEEIGKISTNCSIAVFCTILLSTFLGEKILAFFGIQISSFRVGGGIVIAMTALSMLKAEGNKYKITQEEIDRQSRVREIGIVPLAIPLLAGPGTMTTAIIQSSNIHGLVSWVGIVLATAVVALIVKVVFSLSKEIRKKLGRVSLNVMTRVFGLILLAISIEHITQGLMQLFTLSK